MISFFKIKTFEVEKSRSILRNSDGSVIHTHGEKKGEYKSRTLKEEKEVKKKREKEDEEERKEEADSRQALEKCFFLSRSGARKPPDVDSGANRIQYEINFSVQ